VLYSFAYELYERQFHSIAATVLKRAHELSPQDPKILAELATNLEVMMYNHEAYRHLSNSKEVIDSDEVCRYLLGFHAMMIGKITVASQILPSLENSANPDIQFMHRTLKGMVNRALALKEVRPLDEKDLRGWHMVINGSLLLHLSPFGLEDSMYGRYAYIADSYELILDGLYRLQSVLRILRDREIIIPSILALPDRSSQILASASSQFLNLPLKPWEDIDIETPGLIVAYDLDEISSQEILQDLALHRPNQLLWAHASSWTNPFPYAPDITTYLYQANVSPWGAGRMRLDQETKQVTLTESDESPIKEITKLILEAKRDEEYLEDLDDLVRLIEPLTALESEDQPGIFQRTGRRLRQQLGSPVRSNQFL